VIARTLATIAAAAVLCGSVTLLTSSARACDERYPMTCAVPAPAAEPEAAPGEDPDREITSYAPNSKLRSGASKVPRRNADNTDQSQPKPRAQSQSAPSRTNNRIASAGPAALPWWATRGSDRATMPITSTWRGSADIWLSMTEAARPSSVRALSNAENAEIDIAANHVPAGTIGRAEELASAELAEPESYDLAWLRGILAVFGGAIAAGSAARYFLV
jgi:hypothetical protein